MKHVTPDDAGRWAAGVLEALEAKTLEAHVKACAACEGLLQRASLDELTLAEALDSRWPQVHPARRRALRWVAVPVALAATAALLFARAEKTGAVAMPDAGVEQLADATHFPGEAPPPEALQARKPFAL